MQTRSIRAAAALACLLGLAQGARAVEPVPSDGLETGDDTAQERELFQDDEPWGGTAANTLRLTLQQAIELGIQKNLGVKIQRFNPLIAEDELRIAWGAYDPVWQSDMGWVEDRTPAATVLDGATSSIITRKSLVGQGGFYGLLPFTSTEYSAYLSSSRDTTNFPIVTLSPQYNAEVVFALTQPLLRNLIWNQPWTRVKVSTIAYDSSIERFRLDVMDIVQAIEVAYWNLVATYEQMQVAQKSLETSKALLDQTRTQYDVGVVSKVEVVQAEAGVADREFKLIVDTNVYRQAQDDLIDLSLGEELHPETTLAIQPVDQASEIVEYEVDAEKSAQVAYEQRPELALARNEIERFEIQEKFAKNQRLPQFDLQGIYAYRGLSGVDNPDSVSPPLGRDERYGDAYDDFFAKDGANNWTFRGLFSIPIPNTSARARATQAGIELRQARTRMRRVELDIVVEVRSAVRDLRSSREGIVAAERAVAAAQEQLRAEEIRLEYGESTPFDVLLREEDLVTAESQRIAAYRAYQTSLANLDRRQGTTLRSRNIAIDQVMDVR